MGSHSIDAEVYNDVSTAEEPSAAWGWHRIGKRRTVTAAVLSAIFLLLMNFGNHHGHVETIYLVVIAVAILLMAGLWVKHPHFKQKTTVTAHNRPVGHIEPDWAHDQLTLTGKYADLNDAQLRSLNIDPATVHRPIDPVAAPTQRVIVK
ncbi:DUF2631 domain-containing protein [Corynebacterium choanae]|uniref:DUF2631 domain-containing protein n=1 Tax=Corynebacterium choanae TaxID=1862358 RepID=A0A3G6J7I8_9CORY|nr:DUF2631 domain-containing protein [Corynebacterium choanae]AZA13849.1 hypothetical protein CCHOA_07285 [Corynebacterium choanae]